MVKVRFDDIKNRRKYYNGTSSCIGKRDEAEGDVGGETNGKERKGSTRFDLEEFSAEIVRRKGKGLSGIRKLAVDRGGFKFYK